MRVDSIYAPNGQSLGSDKYAYKLAWYARLGKHLAARHSSRATTPTSRGRTSGARRCCSTRRRGAPSTTSAPGGCDVFREKNPAGGVYTWWDYRMLAFPKGNGLRIDHVLATSSTADRCVDAVVDRDERKGKQPSDHAPVIVRFK